MRLAIAILVFATLCEGPARAQHDSAEALIHRGVELRKKGRDGDALELFRKAFDLGGSSKAEAQMGLAEQALGEWAHASTHLKEALAGSDPWITPHRATLDEALAVVRQHLGSLVLSGGVDGAELALDGERLGVLPWHGPIELEPGEHRLEVTRQGYQPFAARPIVSAGKVVEVRIALQSAAPVAVAPAISPVVEATRPAPSPPRSRKGLWIGVGVGAAVVVIVAVGLGVGLSGGPDHTSSALGAWQVTR
jgi:hypothetical protein